MTAPDDIGPGFVPRPVDGVDVVDVGHEVVLVHGSIAHALNPAGARLWAAFDGTATLSDIAGVVAADSGLDPSVVVDDAVAFARALGFGGLLVGVSPPEPDIALRLIPAPEPGDSIDGLDIYTSTDPTLVPAPGGDRDGVSNDEPLAVTLPDLFGSDLLVISWSPHCGYCAAIGAPLADLVEPFARAGTRVVLACVGDPAVNRAQADALGLDVPVLTQPHAGGPLARFGTPAAVHLDASGRLVSPIVSGSLDVLRSARTLAGLPDEPDVGEVRYLLAADGACPAPSSPGPAQRWSDTRVYDVDGYRFGLRVDSESTARTLDDLFPGRRLEDRRAGHSYAVTLPEPVDGPDSPVRDLNLLVRGADVLVRSRSATRVLRALLWRLADEMVPFDVDGPTVRVDSMAVMVDGVALLVPPGVRVLAPGMARQLARAGIAVADVPRPEVDVRTAELVLRPPAVTHDPGALRDDPVDELVEPRVIAPGRYPLAGWGTVHPAEVPVTLLTPGQAAAALASNVWDPYDFPELIGRLGPLFERVQGFGIWYESEVELIDAITSAARRIRIGRA